MKHKQNYGNDMIYICDPVVAQQVSRLTGCRTLRPQDIEALTMLGHEVIDLDKVLAGMFN